MPQADRTIELTAATTSFFFSSRRRHTSWPRDWSSDVCSSDLGFCDTAQAAERKILGDHLQERASGSNQDAIEGAAHDVHRSEERRVGKECTAQRSPAHRKSEQERAAMFLLAPQELVVVDNIYS